MAELIWDPDFGWAAVDNLVDLNYDHETQMIIDQAAKDQGIVGRDPGMNYRPNITPVDFSQPGAFDRALPISVDFGQIGTPQITMENIMNRGRDLDSGSAAQSFIQNMVQQANLMEAGRGLLANTGQAFNPVSMAQQAQEAAMAAAPEDDPSAQYRALYPDSPSQDVITPTPIPAVAELPTGPQVNDTRVVDGVTETWNGTEWVATPAEAAVAPQTSQFDQIMIELDKSHGVIEWEEAFADWTGTPEELQQVVAKLASNMVAVGAGEGGYPTQKDQVNALTALYKAHGQKTWGGTSVSFTAFTESAGFNWATYNPATGESKDVTGANIQTAAEQATDLGTFFTKYFDSSMFGATKTWRQAVNEFAENLLSAKSSWGDYPGLSGKNFTTVDEVAQWIYQTYTNELSPEQRSNLETRLGVGTINMSDPAFFTKTASTWGTQDPTPTAQVPDGSKTTTTMTKTNPDGTTTTVEVDPENMPQYFSAGYNATTSAGGGPTPVASGTQIPIPTSTPAGIYDPFFEDSQRPFSTVYDPYTATQPGYNMPGIQRAYASARDPLKTQYGMQLPDLQVPGGGIGLDPKYQSADEFLRSLTAGTGQILRGEDLYSRLQDISGALSVDPMGIGTDPQAKLYQDRFGTTAQQKAAFSQPFLMASRGSPEARSALNLAINQAAQRFDYQNPQGVPMAGGGQQGFLGWAMENNLLGINDMFNSPETIETAKLASQAGVPTEGFWNRPASETGAWF
jgi:hypothetical protein